MNGSPYLFDFTDKERIILQTQKVSIQVWKEIGKLRLFNCFKTPPTSYLTLRQGECGETRDGFFIRPRKKFLPLLGVTKQASCDQASKLQE